MYATALCLVTVLGAVNGKYQPICEPSPANHSSGPKLPYLPNAFSTMVEATIVKKNYTAIFFESYDQKADKGMLYRIRNGTKHVDIYDYTLEEIIHIEDKNCTISSTTDTDHGHFSFFGVGGHIESVSKLFRFGREYNETYVGVSHVRGIRCHHWRSCISTNHSSLHLDYYFSVPTWETPRGILNSTVVRAVVNGTLVNFYRSNNGSVVILNGTRDFYNVYDFIDFHPGSQDLANYQIPDGVYCEGYKGANKTEPKFPPVFSMEFELISNHYNVVSSWQETYDVENKLAAFKSPDYWNPKIGPVIQIHDFNTGIGYNITSYHGKAMCHLFNLTERMWDATEDGSHHIRMRTTQELFSRSASENGSSVLVYKGSALVRGVTADIWMAKRVWKIRNKTNEVFQQWYFAKPKWRIESTGYANIQHQVPLRLDFFSSQRGHFVMNLFNVNPVAYATEPTVFDIKPCFTPEAQRLVRFSLNEPKGEHINYGSSKEFLVSLTKKVGAVANVSIIRVNGMQVLDYKKDELVVSFVLLDRPKAIGGDVSVYPEKGLMEGLEALRDSVGRGSFKLQFQGGTLNALPSSFVVGLSASSPTQPPVEQKNGISSGVAAGISVLTLLIGVGGGLLIAHLIMKRRGTGLFQYQKQD